MRTDCPDCRTEMAVGYLLEIGDYDQGKASGQTRWVEGPVERSFWTGVKTKDRLVLPVTTLRCPDCGLLRDYARPAEG